MVNIIHNEVVEKPQVEIVGIGRNINNPDARPTLSVDDYVDFFRKVSLDPLAEAKIKRAFEILSLRQ